MVCNYILYNLSFRAVNIIVSNEVNPKLSTIKLLRCHLLFPLPINPVVLYQNAGLFLNVLILNMGSTE